MVIKLLLSLTFLFLLLIKGFKQQNTTANTLAIIFSLFVSAFVIFEWGSYYCCFSYISYISSKYIAWVAPFVVIGGVISAIYFSKYYGEIIIKFGIGAFIILALLLISSSELFDVEGFITIFTNIVQIIFWILYFITLSSKTNVSLVSKNDPKDW
tara:strand:+ start:124 stop:588 length:465 start_codon:yes stop_codon:yes gene_type:complete